MYKTATQSSTANSGVASRAVDGNLNGIYNSGSVTHTKVDLNAWWEVDLGQQSDITSVALYNRVDCCKDRLTIFEAQLFDYAHWLVN